MANYVLAAVYFTLSGTTVTVQKQQNVASVVRNSTGQYTITFTSTLSTGNYGVIVSGRQADLSSSLITIASANRDGTSGHNLHSTSAVDILVMNSTGGFGAAVEADKVAVICFDPTVSNADILAADYFTVAGTVSTLVANTNVASVTRKAAGIYEHDFSAALSSSSYSVFGGARLGNFAGANAIYNGGNRNSTSGNNLHTTTKFSNDAGQFAGSSSPPPVDLSNGSDTGNFGSILVRDSSATAIGILAGARVSVSGGVCTLVKSTNVSSVTYEAVGWYRVNFTSTLADTNYGTVVQGKWPDTTSDDTPAMSPGVGSAAGSNVYSTSAVDVLAREVATAADVDTFDILVFDASLIGTTAASAVLLGQAWL